MTEMKTSEYFDLEVTGLKCSERPRISELSILALNVLNVLKMNKAIKDNIPNRTIERSLLQTRKPSPRIVNTLTFFVYPMATIVHVTCMGHYGVG